MSHESDEILISAKTYLNEQFTYKYNCPLNNYDGSDGRRRGEERGRERSSEVSVLFADPKQ